jgi:hypothetical protein
VESRKGTKGSRRTPLASNYEMAWKEFLYHRESGIRKECEQGYGAQPRAVHRRDGWNEGEACGLLLSTFITLLVMPVLYSFVEREV